MSKRNQQSPTAVILDGCALLWTIAWPDQGKVQDVVNLFIDLMLKYIAISDVYLYHIFWQLMLFLDVIQYPHFILLERKPY